jgi:hypothetical protein
MWRPIKESGGEEPRIFFDERKLRGKNYVIGFETFKDGDFSPTRQSHFKLYLVRIRDPLALNLGADGEVSFRLQIGSDNLAKTLRSSPSRARCGQENYAQEQAK